VTQVLEHRRWGRGSANLVSVVIPTYERNDLLMDRALPSVLGQTHERLEINVVVDGMRGDSLADLKRRIAALNDLRVRLWIIPRQTYPPDAATKWLVLGMNARNHGLDQARGKWVSSLDDDDEWTPTHVESLMLAIKATDADFAYGKSQYHWPDGHHQEAGKWPPGYGAFCDGAQLYRNGMGYRYDPGCVERGLPEDGDMWNRMWDGGVNFTFVPEVVHHYYPNPR
jgi:glycosyltransferase involved in cell wall biosynthesis